MVTGMVGELVSPPEDGDEMDVDENPAAARARKDPVNVAQTSFVASLMGTAPTSASEVGAGSSTGVPGNSTQMAGKEMPRGNTGAGGSASGADARRATVEDDTTGGVQNAVRMGAAVPEEGVGARGGSTQADTKVKDGGDGGVEGRAGGGGGGSSNSVDGHFKDNFLTFTPQPHLNAVGPVSHLPES